MYGSNEIDLKFPTPIPVNITYQTAFVDDAGKLEIRKDIYGRDAEMIGMLKNSRGKDMESYVAHAQPSYSHPTGPLPRSVVASENSSPRAEFLRAAVRRRRQPDSAAGSGRPPATTAPHLHPLTDGDAAAESAVGDWQELSCDINGPASIRSGVHCLLTDLAN